MEVRQPDIQQKSRQQTSEVSSRSQYMALNDARRSKDLPEVTATTDTSQTSQYAPLHPSTLSGEIPRENVTIEKIIGQRCFWSGCQRNSYWASWKTPDDTGGCENVKRYQVFFAITIFLKQNVLPVLKNEIYYLKNWLQLNGSELF